MPKKKKEESKQVPAEAPKLESTPIKFWKQDGKEGVDVVVAGEDGEQAYMETLKSVIGVKDRELSCHILSEGIAALKPTCPEHYAYNVALQTLNDLQPKDAIEARLAVQASVLFSHGMSNLTKAATTDVLCHADHYSNRAIKLLRLHNETIEALNRYRRGGEQKVTVTHAVITEKAIVNNFNGVGGVPTKNEGESPCSSQNAEQNQEPIAINHVANPQCPTEDVVFTEGNQPVHAQERGKSRLEKSIQSTGCIRSKRSKAEKKSES